MGSVYAVNHTCSRANGAITSFKITADSGAVDRVAPRTLAKSTPVVETKASKMGVHYVAANGSEIKNDGEKKVKAFTDKGLPLNMTWQIAGVKKPLASIGRICDAGNVAVFTDKGGYIIGKAGAKQIIEAANNCGEGKMAMHRENGVYNFRIRIPAKKESGLGCTTDTRPSQSGIMIMTTRLRFFIGRETVRSTDVPVRPSETNVGAPGILRRMWGLEDNERDEFRDAGQWMRGWMEELRKEEEAKRGQEASESNADKEDIDEDGVQPAVKSTEPQPSRQEVEEHMKTHIPYRSWCPPCVRGKARAKYHKGNKDEKHIPTISADYMFIQSGATEDKGMQILVVKDQDSGWLSARVVPKKGINVYALKEMSKIIVWMDYRRAIIETAAIMELKEWV